MDIVKFNYHTQRIGGSDINVNYTQHFHRHVREQITNLVISTKKTVPLYLYDIRQYRQRHSTDRITPLSLPFSTWGDRKPLRHRAISLPFLTIFIENLKWKSQI